MKISPNRVDVTDLEGKAIDFGLGVRERYRRKDGQGVFITGVSIDGPWTTEGELLEGNVFRANIVSLAHESTESQVHILNVKSKNLESESITSHEVLLYRQMP
ncbi:MAG: hypothetical protein ACOVLE_10835, partial [Pirellula staleyi]